MAILVPVRDRLCYPAGYAPGVDPTHPAAAGLRFSGVAMKNNFINLYKPLLKGAITATITGVINGTIGPAVTNPNTTGIIKFAGNSTVAPTTCTFGAIAFNGPNAANNWIYIGNHTNNVTAPLMGCLGASFQLFADNGGASVDSGIPLAASEPVFVAASYSVAGGAVNFVARNLRNGLLLASTKTNNFTAVAGDGIYCVNGDGSGDTSDCTVAAAMYSLAALSPAQLLAWAADPWAFWYPDINFIDDFIVGSATPTPPGPGPNFLTSLMPMMGVG